jgi:hypothetical protein
VNGIVGLMCDCDQKLWVEDARVSTRNIGNRHWVHVMYGDSFMYLITLNTQIAALVPEYDLITNLSPLP